MGSLCTIFAAGSLLLTQEWKSGPVSVALEADPGAVTVAQRCEFRLIASVPAVTLEETLRTGHDRLYWLEPLQGQLRALEGLRLLPDEPVTETSIEGTVRTTYSFRFEPRRTGTIEVPALDLEFSSAFGVPITLRTEPFRFTVRSLVDGDPLQAAPRPALDLPGVTRNAAGAASLALLLALGAAFWIWREKAEPGHGIAERPDSRQAALRELASSKQPSRWREILREYLGADLEVAAASDGRLRQLVRDLDVLRFGREGAVRPKALRKRLETFIRETER